MTLNRTLAPDFHTIEKIDIIRAQSLTLQNGLPLHLINTGTQPLLKLELIFNAGTKYETKPGVSFFTIKMLTEGTKQWNALAISEYIDQYGAFIELNHGAERVSICLFTLNKHLEKLLPLLVELISEAVFPENELANLKNLTLQNLKVNLEKNNFIASQKFREYLFGVRHPYGYHNKEDDIQQIEREDLIKNFNASLPGNQFDVIVAGQVEEEQIALLDKYLGQLPVNEETIYKHLSDFEQNKEKKILVEKPESLQSSLRLGQHLFSKSHPDYFDIVVTNEIFGGYFGSRLMKNIREDKGFTYGIYSSVVSLSNGGYFVIGTDVKKEFTWQTLAEIEKEAEKMKQKPVEEEELQTVKNYMLGSFANSLSTPFDIADVFKSIYYHQLDYDFYEQYVEKIKGITAGEIIECARKYLNISEMLEVVVGGK